ncbi:MAG: FHA domain-containing protein [Lachnospiraceae bacterium]|jgi:hypothetical protein|nr:FHA domain-containing protein [Lachnospiraceae bacterium]
MNLNFRQQSVGETTYLVFDLEDGLVIDTFAMNMMTHNRIGNIVPTQIVQINEKRQAQFNITGLMKINSRMSVVRPKKEVLMVFNSILNAFEEADAYMLDMDHLLLDWDHIYMDREGNSLLLYLPFDHGFVRDKMDFLQEAVSRIQPDFQEKDPYLFDILNAFSRGAVQKLSDFRELIKKSAGPVPDESGKEVRAAQAETPPESRSLESPRREDMSAPKAPLKTPDQTPVPVPEKKRQGSPSAASRIPVINIPGREPGAKPKSEEQEKPAVPKPPKKAKAEKKGFLSSFAVPKKQKENKLSVAVPKSTEIPENRQAAEPDASGRGRDDMYESYESTVLMEEPAQRRDSEPEGTVLLEEEGTVWQISARLVRRQGGFTYRIDRDRITVGSGMSADIRIEDNHAVSRSHALIQYVNGEFYIEDNQSKNGSFLDGKRLQPGARELLSDGMVVRLANEEFEFFRD